MHFKAASHRDTKSKEKQTNSNTKNGIIDSKESKKDTLKPKGEATFRRQKSNIPLLSSSSKVR